MSSKEVGSNVGLYFVLKWLFKICAVSPMGRSYIRDRILWWHVEVQNAIDEQKHYLSMVENKCRRLKKCIISKNGL